MVQISSILGRFPKISYFEWEWRERNERKREREKFTLGVRQQKYEFTKKSKIIFYAYPEIFIEKSLLVWDMCSAKKNWNKNLKTKKNKKKQGNKKTIYFFLANLNFCRSNFGLIKIVNWTLRHEFCSKFYTEFELTACLQK